MDENDSIEKHLNRVEQFDSCIGCKGAPDYAAFIVLNSQRFSPRLTLNTRKIPICKSCCNPGSPHYADVGRTLAVMIFGVQNDMEGRKKVAASG